MKKKNIWIKPRVSIFSRSFTESGAASGDESTTMTAMSNMM